MNLKNYTSSVPSSTSIWHIEQALIAAGASAIAKEYDTSGKVTGFVFRLVFEAGQPPATVKLPANVTACHESMWKDHVKNRSFRSRKTSEDFKAQAERTAWRIMQDWVEVQVSLIKIRQIDAMQAFLPFCFDGERTVYEKVKEGGFKALTAPKPEPEPAQPRQNAEGTTIEV